MSARPLLKAWAAREHGPTGTRFSRPHPAVAACHGPREGALLETLASRAPRRGSGMPGILWGWRSSDHGRTAVTSISTSQPGLASAATWTAERVGRFGCAAVPNFSR